MEPIEAVVERVLDSRGKERVQTINTLPSKTVKSDRDLTDIRTIIGKIEGGGVVENLGLTERQFVDVKDLTDFADVMRVTREAELEFMKLPSKTREKFGHDVAQYLDAAHDQEKRDALIAAGVIEAPKGPVEAAQPDATEGPAEGGGTVV